VPPSVVVFPARAGDLHRAGRTLRALRGAGLAPFDATAASPRAITRALGKEGAWLVRAGAWPVAAPSFPPPSATGLPLCALGAVRAESDGDRDTARWKAILASTGGDLGRVAETPPLASVFLAAPLAERVAARVREGEPIAAALAALFPLGKKARLVRYAPLDVRDDEALRVTLAVTSLQQGGAERMVLDLAAELPAAGVRPLVVTTGKPTRAAFPMPAHGIDLSDAGPRAARLDALARTALENASDLVHAHLLSRDDHARLAACGVPVAITVHNTRPGFPEGLERIEPAHAALLVACSLAVERDLREATIPVPVRTVWNGIDAARFRPSSARRRAGADFRRELDLGADDLVLLAIANPRPQKRLDLLPEVLLAARAELARRGIAREARLVLVGDAEPRAEAAAASMAALRDAIARLDLGAHVRLAGSRDDPLPALAAADVLVSMSAHEGLSLAHLEALAAGLPVVAADAGGTREIAPEHPALAVVPAGEPPSRGGEIAVALALDRPPSAHPVIEAGFSRARMAARYATLYPRAIAAERARRGEGLLLVANNFSTGGAQSSARRLLRALAEKGLRVRAAVLEEQPRYPTPGRRALEDAGIPVLALPPPGEATAEQAAARLVEWIDAEPPRALLFWNALAEHKIHIADRLLATPIFDVSPGEMYFSALDRTLSRSRPGLPYRDARAYGARLAGVIVKYAAEAARAAEVLGAPVHVIPNGLPLGDRPAPRVRREAAPLVIGTAARLSPQKKLEALFAALRLARPHLPPHVIRIAGGPERGGDAYAAALREQAHGLDVEWLGDLPDTRAFLADLDVFAMISEPAGCPNASLEAMAAGLPVIATDVGGASEQVIDGETGRLVPRDDAEAFAAALVEIAASADLRARFGAAGRARAEARFDVSRMVADYERVCLRA
jgi:glycosyltransferase involved in cell wall biosynthesis